MVEVGADRFTKAIVIFGILIFLSGIGSFVAGCVWVGIFSSRGITTDGSGIWSGILLFVAGCLGMLVWRTRKRGLVIAFLVLSILACIAASIQALIAGVAHNYLSLHSDKNCYVTSDGYCHCINSRGEEFRFLIDNSCGLVSTFIGGLISILTFNVFGAFFTLIGSIYGCMASCGNLQTSGVVVMPPAGQPSVVFQPGQPVVYVQQQPGVQPQYNMGYAQQPASNPQATPGSAGAMAYQPSDPPPHYRVNNIEKAQL